MRGRRPRRQADSNRSAISTMRSSAPRELRVMIEPPASRVVGILGDLGGLTGVAPQDLPDQPHLELHGALGAADLATDLGIGVALESPDQELSEVHAEEAEHAGQLDP